MRSLPNLDFLRAVAVISVVVDHTLLAYGHQHLGPIAVEWIGVVGVFLFFVHTSLVLMWSLERKPHVLDFYIRRIFRIHPLAMVAVAAALIFHAPVSGAPTRWWFFWSPHLVRKIDVAAAFLLVQNLTIDYKPINVLWSLPYEVEMYLCLPLLFFFVQKNFSRWPLIVFWIASILLMRHTFQGVAHNFFLCIPYFLPGVIAYVGFGRTRARLPFWTFPIFLAALWAGFLFRPGWRRADVLCLVAGLALPLFHQVKCLPLIRASHEVAKYSYGIYLAHPFALVLGLYLLPGRPLVLQLSVFFLSLAVLAIGGYHLIEFPMIRLGSRLAARAERRYEQHELSHFRARAEDNA